MAFGEPTYNGDFYTIQLASKVHGVERIDMGVTEFTTGWSEAIGPDLEIFQRVLRDAGFQVSVRRLTRYEAYMESPPVEETPEEPDSGQRLYTEESPAEGSDDKE